MSQRKGSPGTYGVKRTKNQGKYEVILLPPASISWHNTDVCTWRAMDTAHIQWEGKLTSVFLTFQLLEVYIVNAV